MATRPVRLLGDPVLRTPAATVTTFDKELRNLVKDLQDTMLDAPGVGPREHRRHLVAAVDQGLQAGQGRLRRPGEDQPHGRGGVIARARTAGAGWP